MAAKGNKRKPGQPKSIEASLKELEKLGFGTLTHPETRRWIAHVVLFAHMKDMLAIELQNLRDRCLPLYKALHERGRAIDAHSDFPALVIREVVSSNTIRSSRLWVESWASLAKAMKHSPLAKELAATISQWADGLHMQVDWFLDAVLMNLCLWRKDSKAETDLQWLYPGSMLAGEHQRGGIDLRRLHGWGTLDRVIPAPVVKPYNPSTQTRIEHLQMLEVELNAYYDKQEDLFTSQGFQETILKRARTVKQRPWLHFEWFIKYQMQGALASEIAEKYQQGIGEDAIHRALRDLAGILQVTLRPRVKNSKKQLKKKKLNS